MHLHTESAIIDTTTTHPFYVVGKGFVATADLQEDDKIYALDGSLVEVKDVEIEKLEEEISVYNLEVEENHTYFVGEDAVLVHNSCGGSDNTGTPDVGSEGGNSPILDDAINNGQPLNNHRLVPDSEASSLPATKQPPDSSADLLNPDGSVKQRRYYGEDGKAQMDIDFYHTDDGTHKFPHIHIWDWTQKPPRQDSRR